MSAAGNAALPGAQRRWVPLSLVVLALGLYFRCANLGGRPLGFGEGLKSLQVMLVETAPPAPLYYCLLGWWAGLAGDSTAGLRAFSVLAGVAAILLAYWLGLELFGSRRVAGLAAALTAVSPFHALISRQARPEALFTVTVLASCGILLRALRRDRRRDWVFHELTVIAGVYTDLVFLAVLAAQGIWVAAWTRGPEARPRRPSPALLRYRKAAAGAVLAFLPWAVVMVFHAQRNPAWLETLLEGGAIPTAVAHFKIPAYLVVQFALAWALARGYESSAALRRRVWQVVTAAVLVFGVISNIARG